MTSIAMDSVVNMASLPPNTSKRKEMPLYHIRPLAYSG